MKINELEELLKPKEEDFECMYCDNIFKMSNGLDADFCSQECYNDYAYENYADHENYDDEYDEEYNDDNEDDDDSSSCDSSKYDDVNDKY